MVTDLSLKDRARYSQGKNSLVSLGYALFFEVGSPPGLVSTIYRSDGTPGGNFRDLHTRLVRRVRVLL